MVAVSEQLAAGVNAPPALELKATVPVGAVGPGAAGNGPVSVSVAVQLTVAGRVTVAGAHASVVALACGSESTATPNGALAPVMKL